MEVHDVIPGKRILKTSLAVGICLVISAIFQLRGGFYMTIASVLTMKATPEKSMDYGLSRTKGTMVGGVVGLILILLFQHFQIAVSSFAYIILNMVGTIFCIWVAKIFRQSEASATSACVVLFTVTINRVAESAVPLPYVLTRVVETLVGIFVAVIVNRFVGNKPMKIPS
ncbi:MAG: FUSC family protein [Breznakia sp.]